MMKIYLCSRYSGDVERNKDVAQYLCRELVQLGHAPFAPHLLYTQFLNDDDPGERVAGMACGHAFMEDCDEVWVWTHTEISDGMKADIAKGRELNKPVMKWSPADGVGVERYED